MGKWFVVLFSYIIVFFLGLGKVSLFAILFSYTSSRGTQGTCLVPSFILF